MNAKPSNLTFVSQFEEFGMQQGTSLDFFTQESVHVAFMLLSVGTSATVEAVLKNN